MSQAEKTIQSAAVIGAGVMGAGIAAHIANAGVPVRLIDIVPDGADDRNQLAKGAIARMTKADPAPFMSKRAIKLVTPGNIEDDLEAPTAMERRPRTRELVVLTGETPELDGLAEPAEGDEQFLGLTHRTPDVVLAVDD